MSSSSRSCGRSLAPLLGAVGIFILASGGLYLLATSLSQQIEDGSSLSFPKSLEELRALSVKLSLLQRDHFYSVLGLFSAAYLFKQSFAIPGSVFLNVLAGAMFGVWYGLPLVCFLTATGASCCYMLSWLFGKELVLKYLSHKIRPLQAKLRSDDSSLLFILISLRLFPMAPNWLLNMASPLVGVPMHLFFASVLVGLLPYNFLCVQAGLVLSELQVISVLDPWSLLTLLLAAGSLLAVAFLVRRCRQRAEGTGVG